MRERTLRSLIDAPRWLLLITLVYAPWAYGCTVRWAIDLLDILMALTIGAWVLGGAACGRWPRVPRACLLLVVLLLAVGWGMTLNPQFRHDPLGPRFAPVVPLVAFAPGTVDQATSLAAMWRYSGLLGVLLFVTDFTRRPEWRRRVWWCIGLTGTSIIFLGLVQRASGLPLMFPYTDQARMPFFGTYFYHGNAGAFINLVLPAIAGLLLVSIRKAVDDLGRLLWVPALLMALAGAGICFSRAALVITGGIAIAMGIWAVRHLPGSFSRGWAILYAALVLLVLAGVSLALGWEPMIEKWRMLGQQLNAGNPRYLAVLAAWRMVGDAGALGFGPGTFGIAFPHYTEFLGTSIRGVWRFAHQDYLQTWIEWGWVGMTLWVGLFGGGIWKGLRWLRTGKLHTEDRTLLFAGLVALGGVAMHAMIDFPLQIASLQLYVAVYLGLCWGSPQWNASDEAWAGERRKNL